MLKKIENISSSAEMKSHTHLSTTLGTVSSIQSGRTNFLDSLSFSTAFKYLSQLKWQLKSLKRTENDEIAIEFKAGDFTFITLVNLYNHQSNNIIYRIIDKDDADSDKPYNELRISFDFNSVVYSESSFESSQKFIKLLFERINSYGRFISNTHSDFEQISYLFEEFEDELIYELSFIHKNVIHFIEKVIGEMLFNNFKIPSSHSDSKRKFKILQINVKK